MTRWLPLVVLLGCGDGTSKGDSGAVASTPTGGVGAGTPVGTPGGTTPAGSTPAGTPTGTTPTGTTPAGTTPAGTAPTDLPPLPVCINELMPDNGGSLDVDGEAPDWIELHNPGVAAVDLTGWFVSDTADDPTLHRLDGLGVPPGGFLLLFADDDVGLGPDHLPFKLAADGEAVVLRDPEGRTSVVRYGPMSADVSAARTTDCCDGGCWGYPYAGTPGISNVVVEPPPPPIEVDDVVLSAGGTWRWWSSEDAPDPDWAAVDFDDGAWSSGPAPLGYGDGHIVTALPYGADAGNKWPAAYFRFAFDVADLDQVQQVVLELMRDDGAVVWLNGVEVRRDNLPGGPITHWTRASVAMSGGDETAYRRSEVGPEALREGANVVAVEVHQATAGSSDLGFDCTVLLERLVPVD